MARVGSACPVCSRSLINSRFDTTFRLPDGSERFFFGLPASLCEMCQQLYLDPDLIELLSEIPDGRCTFAIETDRCSYPRPGRARTTRTVLFDLRGRLAAPTLDSLTPNANLPPRVGVRADPARAVPAVTAPRSIEWGVPSVAMPLLSRSSS